MRERRCWKVREAREMVGLFRDLWNAFAQTMTQLMDGIDWLDVSVYDLQGIILVPVYGRLSW